MTTFTVGEWTAKPDSGRLRRGNSRVKLQPQVMELLQYLAIRAGEVVSIEQMIDEVWHGKPMTSGSVYNSLNALRNAFNDDPNNPAYIENIPRIGYRLIAPVRWPESAAEAEKFGNGLLAILQRRIIFKVGLAYLAMSWLLVKVIEIATPRLGLPEWAATLIIVLLVVGFFPVIFIVWAHEATPAGVKVGQSPDGADSAKRHAPPPLNWLIAMLLVAAVGLMSWERFGLDRGSQRFQEDGAIIENSIAVLPFADMSPDGDQQYLSDGISEEILNVLASHPDLKVVGRTSSFRFREQGADLRDVGDKLGVNYILEGSVRRDGDQLRVTAQLIGVKGGFHLWSQTYEKEVGSVFAIQDEIAQSVKTKLNLTMLGEDQPQSVEDVPTEFDVHDLYLLAHHRVTRGSPEDVDEALSLLERALVIDPNYAPAHLEMAYAMFEQRSLPNRFGLVMDKALQARDLNPDLAGLNALIGRLDYIAAWNGKWLPESALRAEESLNNALKLNPNDSRALLWYSGLKRLQGKPWLESVEMARRAWELDPLYSFAAEHYLSLIDGLPAYRQEKWRLIRKLVAGDLDYGLSTAALEGNYHVSEGHLAETINLLEPEHPHDPDDLDSQWGHLISSVNLGEFSAELQEDMVLSNYAYFGLLPRDHPQASVMCPDKSDEKLSHTQSVNRCSSTFLLAGQFDMARAHLEKFLPENNNVFLEKYRHTFIEAESAAMTMATLHVLRGEHDLAREYLEMTEQFLHDIAPDNDFQAAWLSRTRAYLYALRGETSLAIAELNKVMNWGFLEFTTFMHPAFIKMHDHPEYLALKQRWMDLVNDQRVQLGLDELGMNPKAGPGTLPFRIRTE